MSDAPNPLPPPKPDKSIWRDFLVALPGGAIGGLAVATASIGFGIAMDLGLSLENLWNHGVHLGQVFDRLDERFFGGPFWGMLGVPVTMLIAGRRRNPIFLSILWASILGTLPIAMAAIFLLISSPPTMSDTVLMLVAFVGVGAIYGFVLGFGQLIVERVLDRIVRPAPGTETPR